MTGAVPSERDYLDLLGRAARADARTARQGAQRGGSAYRRSVIARKSSRPSRACLRMHALLHFICDYFRLIIMGNARHARDRGADGRGNPDHRPTSKLKPYHALVDGRRGACRRSASWRRCSASSRRWVRSISRRSFSAASSARRWSAPSPASSCPTASSRPCAHKIKMMREKRCRLYVIVKQTLLAFMNGAHAADRARARPQDDRPEASGRRSTSSRTRRSPAPAAKSGADRGSESCEREHDDGR